MSLMDKIKSMLGGSAASHDDHDHSGHDHAGHDHQHGHDHSHDDAPAAPLDPLGTTMPEAAPGPTPDEHQH